MLGRGGLESVAEAGPGPGDGAGVEPVSAVTLSKWTHTLTKVWPK